MHLLVTLSLVAALVQAPSAPAPPSNAVAADAAPDVAQKVEKLRTEGFTALYSLDYAGAGRAFNEIVAVAPDLPQGYIFRATNTWFESLYKQRLLSTSLYTHDEYYEQKERTVDPKVDASFRADIAKAIALGDARVKTNPNDVEALYYLGAAHGSLAGYEATMAHAFMSSLKHGSKSVDLHEKVLELDKTYVDAYLTLGMYHYVVGSLPLPVKLLAAMGGARGSKKNGLAELERVVKEGRRNSDDARVLLISLYTREGRLDEALAILATLRAKYPANYVVMLEEAKALADLKRYPDSYAAFDRLRASERAMAEATDYVEFSTGEAHLAGGDFKGALEHYKAVSTWKGADTDVVTLARLGAGQCLDALGQRTEAIANYRIVLRREDVLDSRKRAQQLIDKPYAPSSPTAPTGQARTASRVRAISSGVVG